MLDLCLYYICVIYDLKVTEESLSTDPANEFLKIEENLNEIR